jgi:hypothetical protein
MSHVEQTDTNEDEGAEMNEHMRPRGRHNLPRSSRPRTSGLRPFRVIAAATGLVAGVAAITLALTGVPGHAAEASHKIATTAAAVQAPTLTPAEAAVWHKAVLTKKGREKVFEVFEDSYGRVADVGTGPLVIPGTSQLDLSWGLSGSGGEHFWIIASYADILSKALGKAEPCCELGLSLIVDPVVATAVCIGIEVSMDHLAQGYGPLSNHGVWAEIHFWSFWTGVYRW